jgi:hypothetical protein
MRGKYKEKAENVKDRASRRLGIGGLGIGGLGRTRVEIRD